MPVKVILSRFCTFFLSPFFDKEWAWYCLDIQHYELAPVQVQLQWCLIWMHWVILDWNIDWLDKTSSDTIRYSLDELFLSWLLCIVDTENVWSTFRWCLENLFYHSGKIFHVDSRDKILALSNNWKFLRILEPCLFEMAVEDCFSRSIQNTGWYNKYLHIIFLEV